MLRQKETSGHGSSAVPLPFPPADTGLPNVTVGLVQLPEQSYGDYNFEGWVAYSPTEGQPGYHQSALPACLFVSDGVVPLPPSIFLFGAGLLGLGAWRRFKRG